MLKVILVFALICASLACTVFEQNHCDTGWRCGVNASQCSMVCNQTLKNLMAMSGYTVVSSNCNGFVGTITVIDKLTSTDTWYVAYEFLANPVFGECDIGCEAQQAQGATCVSGEGLKAVSAAINMLPSSDGCQTYQIVSGCE